jgi:2-dehydropantoate 2-reductase
VKLAEAGQDVSVIARGAHLAAIQNSGLTLLEGDKTLNQPVRAASDAAELGVQDFVIVGVKATGLQAIAASLAPLIGPRTLVAFPQNGMSWWYPLDLPSHLPPPPHIPIFDRKDDFLPLMEKPQIAGGSIYSANELAAPGIIQNNSPGRNSLTLGLITPGFETELATVQAALRAAGIESPVVADIRRIVWSKLLVNMTGSTIALATESMATVCRTDPALEEIYRRLVEEGLTIAAAYGRKTAGPHGRPQAVAIAGLRAWQADGDRRNRASPGDFCPRPEYSGADHGHALRRCEPPRQG